MVHQIFAALAAFHLHLVANVGQLIGLPMFGAFASMMLSITEALEGADDPRGNTQILGAMTKFYEHMASRTGMPIGLSSFGAFADMMLTIARVLSQGGEEA